MSLQESNVEAIYSMLQYKKSNNHDKEAKGIALLISFIEPCSN